MNNAIPVLDSELCATVDLHGIKLIEASAGTGKTYTIANLYLRYILEGYSPDQILVVTFTKAATEELRGRIRARLIQARHFIEHSDAIDDGFLKLILGTASTSEKNSLRLQVAIRSMDEASIFTIHGFCQKLLLDHALLTNHAYELSIENDDFEGWQQAFFDWWRTNSYSLPKYQFYHLSHAIGNLNGIKSDLLRLKDDIDLPLLPLSNTTLEDVFSQWQEIQTEIGEIKHLWIQHRDTAVSQITESKALSASKDSPYNSANLVDLIEALELYFETNFDQLPNDYFAFVSRSSLHKYLKPSYRDKENNFTSSLFDAVENCLNLVRQYLLSLRTAAINQARKFIQQQTEKVKRKNNHLAFQDLLTHSAFALEQDSTGELKNALLKQFPVAMIDEFQDTDQQQFGIFKSIYQFNNNGDLILIGDPKQSIYAFRGGDIFTYLDARQSMDLSLYSLKTNWRSSQGLVQAVNKLYSSNANAFGEYLISYQDVNPSEQPAPPLLHGEPEDPAITIWEIPSDDKGKPLSKEDCTTLVCHSVAVQIKTLIESGSDYSLNGNPVKPADIAILVRTSLEAKTLQSILASYHLPAVYQSRESVYQTREAEDLRVLLHAILDCRNQSTAKRGLASGLFNYTTSQIIEIFEDEELWQAWLDHLSHLHQLWNRRGFIQMFQQMLIDLKAAHALLKQDFAHRRLTNLLHLGELLQDESSRNAGMHSLLNWFRVKLDSDTAEESKIRLESDDSLIRIVTIHSSKGLEYPIVFLPFLWSARAAKTAEGEMVMCHTKNNQKVADIGSEQWKNHLNLSLSEDDAEQMRILYVALTRACSKVYTAWGNVGGKSVNSSRTAFARLVHPILFDPGSGSRIASGFDASFDVLPDLNQLAQLSENTIEVSPLPTKSELEQIEPTILNTEAPASLSHSNRPPRQDWKINSFSGLTRNIHQVAHGGSNQGSNDPILDFQAGSKIGLFLHEILENIDFSGDIDLQCRQLVPDRARTYGISLDNNPDLITKWIENIVHCKLDLNSLCLQKISPQQRLNELPFDFTVTDLDIRMLNQFLESQQRMAMTALEVKDFSGLITGIIDLVFEYNGKFYLADYKSNQLGHDLNDYTSERLNKAIIDRRYDLQSLLYSLALHRYLKSRIPDYSYDKHFGGSYYLFLRAMRKNSHSKYGVYFHRVDYSTITEFDGLFCSQTKQVH